MWNDSNLEMSCFSKIVFSAKNESLHKNNKFVEQSYFSTLIGCYEPSESCDFQNINRSFLDFVLNQLITILWVFTSFSQMNTDKTWFRTKSKDLLFLNFIQRIFTYSHTWLLLTLLVNGCKWSANIEFAMGNGETIFDFKRMFLSRLCLP